ncbi:MAG: NAD(P)/FAD-dependent oxidoreductase [Thiotrichales bacterium]|nr:MAG: NAD(P)/FAD-dependent oxidoreductase [Thiotrichales bacterium]
MTEAPNKSMHTYDLAVIGGGAGGLVVASVAAQLGLRVALVEKEKQLGGDCLHFGCVPSKSLLRSAHVAHLADEARDYGIEVTRSATDMQRVNACIRRAIDRIQQHDSHERFRELGCEIFTGTARFVDANRIRVGDIEIRARRYVIATGSSAWIPAIEGLQSVDYLTNEDMFSLAALPEHLLVLGAGPVGVEMAQAYARLGSRVSLIELADRVLPQFDRDISRMLKQQLLSEDINIVHGETRLVSQQGETRTVVLDDGRSLSGDQLLVAIGRRPVVTGLGLEQAGVDYTEKGIRVNARMQTSRRHIYACGDVTGQMPLTHVAEQQAGVIIANALFRLPKRMDYRVIPAVVYTEPECAQVGMQADEAVQDASVKVVQFDMKQLDRAITDNTDHGVMKLIVRKGRLAGAHAIGHHAGELIHELALAIRENMKLSKITTLVHAYPSYSQLNRRAASQYYRDSLFSPVTANLVKVLSRWLP